MLERYCELFRVVWLEGRYGSGKTALALHLAGSLVSVGAVDSIATNFDLLPPWGLVGEYPSFRDLMATEEGCCIIFDEAWSELGVGATPKAVKQYLAFLRKKASVLLMPSVIPLVRTVQVCRVHRVFNAFTVGLPLWLYRYTVATGERKPETGLYWWWYPSRVWGWYESSGFPGETWRVYRWGCDSSSSAA